MAKPHVVHGYEIFDPEEYLSEFQKIIPTLEYTDRTPLNTEMFFLWCMIRTRKPQLFLESGTFRGYSGMIICEALKRNDNNAQFITIGFDLDGCMSFSRERLSPYSFATVIEGDSREYLRGLEKNSKNASFFIDGPKGPRMYPLFRNLIRKFENIEFIAVHDCNSENGSRNRFHVHNFFGNQYPYTFTDNDFQEKYGSLNDPLIKNKELNNWSPYTWNGSTISSYGTETAFILVSCKGRGSLITATGNSVRRFWNVTIIQGIFSIIRQISKNVGIYHRLKQLGGFLRK